MTDINEILKNNGVISFVTDTVWGVGCLPSSRTAVDKIYELKGRDRSKPLILMSNALENLIPYVDNMSTTAYELAQKHFPGAITIVCKKSAMTEDYMTSNMPTVGIRVPDNFVFKKICENIDGHVLATTSANLSGTPSAKNYREALTYIGNFVDYVVPDESDPAKGLESTVVLAPDENIKVLRQGAVEIPGPAMFDETLRIIRGQ